MGYSKQGAAQSAGRLLKKANIANRIAELGSAIEERTIEKSALNRTWIINQLRENVERAMPVSPMLDRDGTPVGEFRYEGNVANRALELLGKELGMFKDRVGLEHSGPESGPIPVETIHTLPAEDLQAIEEILKRAIEARQAEAARQIEAPKDEAVTATDFVEGTVSPETV